MHLKLLYEAPKNLEPTLQITGSKSESNRLLILQALFPKITIANLSKSDDTTVLKEGISKTEGVVDIHHAGTAMRFLTAYFAAQEGTNIQLTGSTRMQERPISILVEALRTLGADIEYEQREGYPPLRIKGKNLHKNTVSLKANVSSQYISALMLIAPTLEQGLTITLEGTITSVPYITMTLSLLKQLGIDGNLSNQTINILPFEYDISKTITVESDWSSASYFYSIMALAPLKSITLKSYKNNSLQGDKILSKIYNVLGVTTTFNATQESITLSKSNRTVEDLTLDLSNAPDIAQTIAVTCFGLGIPCYLTGLHTLKIKETDRLKALKKELEKLGAVVNITEDTLTLMPRKIWHKDVAIETYNDHRMAMAFAPLAIKMPLTILDSKVVSKSFPRYWKDLSTLGFLISEE